MQWTVEIASEQSFAVYERVKGKGTAVATKLVAGDPDKAIKASALELPHSLSLSNAPSLWQVVDHWVFERPIFKSWIIPKPGPRGAEWRLVARIKQPEGRPPSLAAAHV